MRHFLYRMGLIKVMQLCIVFAVFPVLAFMPSEQYSDIQYKDLEENENGYWQNTSRDSFIVFNNIDLNRAQMCVLVIKLEFAQAPSSASLFDSYWRAAGAGFSESQKGSFIISHKQAQNNNTYAIPLCKLYGFSGNLDQPNLQKNIDTFRLDYPSNKNMAIKFDSLAFISHAQLSELPDTVIMLEPYERISGRSFTSLDVIIPKLFFAFQEGLKRLSQDITFLIFWLVIIVLLTSLILRSFIRPARNNHK